MLVGRHWAKGYIESFHVVTSSAACVTGAGSSLKKAIGEWH